MIVDNRVTVSVVGELDYSTSTQLREALTAALTIGVGGVAVDFHRVEFCDCSGLAVLLGARRRAHMMGISFRVTGPLTPVVARLLQVTETESSLLVPTA
ncbi:STAS domain-containing protein [Streptomyces sp. WAC 04229]|uniref:STAS domain-containing protein n=1 Tax=Streptomyces sp. WAC 04229 TaxID=2203206 RepID=UPI003D75F451